MTGGAHLRRNLHLTRAALVALLAALIGLAIICGRLYAQNTNDAVESEVLKSMQTSLEQAKHNLDYRLQQTSDGARTLLGAVYPYLNSSAGLEGQLEEYSEMTRVLNEYVGKHMISRIRLYVPDGKVYARQRETFYALSELSDDADFKALVGDHRGGVFWTGPQQVSIINGNDILAIACVAVVSHSKNYNQFAGVLRLDIDVGAIGSIFQSAGSAKLYLVDEGGAVVAHADPSRIGQTAQDPQQMARISAEKSGYFSGEKLVAFEKIDTCDWYLVCAIDRAALHDAGGPASELMIVLIVVTLLVALVVALITAYDIMLSHTTHSINQAVKALETEGESPQAGQKPRRMDALAQLSSSAGKMAVWAQKVTEERYQNRWRYPNTRCRRCRRRSSRIFCTTRWM